MTAAKNAGLKVFRTWGFNDKNATYNPQGIPNYSDYSGEVIFQRFGRTSSDPPAINVAQFDKVVNAATKTGIKLIVALTNNWADYGGESSHRTPCSQRRMHERSEAGFQRAADRGTVEGEKQVLLWPLTKGPGHRSAPLAILRQP